MRRIYFFALCAFAVLGFTSCDKDDDGNASDSEIVGTWEGDNSDYHYPVVTFKSDGTYEWIWDGIHKLKDTGTYTYDGKTISTKAQTYYEWDDEKGKYVKNTESYQRSPRVCKVVNVTAGILEIKINDYFIGGGGDYMFDFVMYRKGVVQNIKSSDLQGTWEHYDEGELSDRIIINGNKYTSYEVWESESLAAIKSEGDWSVSNGVLTVTPKTLMYSYSNDNTGRTTYSNVDSETLEADRWYPAQYDEDPFTERIYLSEDKSTLYVAGKVFVKKK